MERSSSSECATTVRRDDDRGSIRDDIGMDGKRQHQQIREGASHGGSVDARTFLVYGPHVHPVADDHAITAAWRRH